MARYQQSAVTKSSRTKRTNKPNVMTFGRWVMTQQRLKDVTTLIDWLPETVTAVYMSPDVEHNARFSLSQGVSGQYYLTDECDSGLKYRVFASFELASAYISAQE